MWLVGNVFPHITFKDIKNKNWCLFLIQKQILKATKSNAKLDKNIGKYGRLRLNYLKHNHMDIYTILLMDDRLNEHLLEVDREAKEKVKRLVDDICKKENVTEKLKENNQMERVKLMNNFKIIAEEIVEKELVFCQKGE
jgi:hypothetical protein